MGQFQTLWNLMEFAACVVNLHVYQSGFVLTISSRLDAENLVYYVMSVKQSTLKHFFNFVSKFSVSKQPLIGKCQE